MALYQVTITYDGTEFSGFQRQLNLRTVQGELEKTLKVIGWEGKSILASGRTDYGVHANGQVVCFDLNWKHSVESLKHALNGNLPADISAANVILAGSGFHPRYSAKSRCYRYQIYFLSNRNPLKDRYYWRVWPKPDEEKLIDASKVFLGRHDFCFLGKPSKKGGLTVRTILKSNWHFLEGEAWYEIESESFLYHMVRRITFLQIITAKGILSQEELENGFEKRQLAAGIAPPNGLFLENVTY
jgi:tRNA pseudouridine38-40 synthase